MRLNIKVSGLDSAIKGFSVRSSKAKGTADKVTEAYTRKMANEAGDNAPVKTGNLRANVKASPFRLQPGTWEFGGTLPYARRQEYEHKTHKGFIRKAVWRNRSEYRNVLRREVIDL